MYACESLGLRPRRPTRFWPGHSLVRNYNIYELEIRNWESLNKRVPPPSPNSVGAQPTRPAHTHWNSAQFHDDSEHYDLHVTHTIVSLISSEVELSWAPVLAAHPCAKCSLIQRLIWKYNPVEEYKCLRKFGAQELTTILTEYGCFRNVGILECFTSCSICFRSISSKCRKSCFTLGICMFAEHCDLRVREGRVLLSE